MEEPKINQKTNKYKPKGQTRERMIEVSKIGNQVKKENALISNYEKQKEKEEQNRIKMEKLAIIYKEKERLEKAKEVPLQQEEELKQQEEVPQQQEEVPIKKEKKKRIKEIIEEVEEEESSSEEEEIIIKRIIKKVPKKKIEPTTNELYDLSNQDLLKRKLYENTKKRLMNDLFQ